MPGRLQFDFQFSEAQRRLHDRPAADTPFRMLVIGDFSGRKTPEDPAGIAARPIHALDIDNFDRILARLAPTAHVAVGPQHETERIAFSSLQDFHPDRLYDDLHAFGRMKELRTRLLDPATFPLAAAALGWVQERPEQQGATVSGRAAAEGDGALLERLLGAPPAGGGSGAIAPTDAIDALIRRLVGPHIAPAAPPFQQQYLASLDEAAIALMREVLHDREFQAIESVWRGAHWLVSRLDLGESLTVRLLDLSLAELRADVLAAARPEDGQLYRRLTDEADRGEAPWSLLVGTYTFARSAEDARLLGAVGAIAARIGAPFLAAADPSLLGCTSLLAAPHPEDWSLAENDVGDDWLALRASGVARWIGLALPRLLLRLPYGKDTDPPDRIPLQELATPPAHECYLWGNPALACALLLAQSFQDKGWDMEPGDRLDLGDLPAHMVETNEGKRMQACAELYFGERAGEAILERGPMALMSSRSRNAVRVMRFQSIALPSAPLAGPWDSN